MSTLSASNLNSLANCAAEGANDKLYAVSCTHGFRGVKREEKSDGKQFQHNCAYTEQMKDTEFGRTKQVCDMTEYIEIDTFLDLPTNYLQRLWYYVRIQGKTVKGGNEVQMWRC